MAITDSDAEGLGCLLAVLLFVPAVVWSAWVMMKLWGWFLVPLGVPAIGLWHAAGLRVLIGDVAKTHVPDEDTDYMVLLLKWVLGPALVLALGWVFQHGMT